MKHHHEWLPLFKEDGQNVDRVIQAILEHHADYVRCACGRIGRYIHSNRGGVRLLNEFGQTRLTQKAAQWEAK